MRYLFSVGCLKGHRCLVTLGMVALRRDRFSRSECGCHRCGDGADRCCVRQRPKRHRAGHRPRHRCREHSSRQPGLARLVCAPGPCGSQRGLLFRSTTSRYLKRSTQRRSRRCLRGAGRPDFDRRRKKLHYLPVISSDETVVYNLAGHGLKQREDSILSGKVRPIAPTLDALRAQMTHAMK